MGRSRSRHSGAEGDDSDSTDDDSSTGSLTCSTHLDDYLVQPNAMQVQFIDLVGAGNVERLLEFVKKHELQPSLFVDCTNNRGHTALEIAVGKGDTVMVHGLIRLGVGRKSVDCALIRATQLGDVNLVKVLLSAAVTELNVSSGVRRGRPKQDCCADYTCDLDPLLMAAQCDHYDMVKLLIARGFKIDKPHSAHCRCDKCMHVTTQGQSLHQTIGRLNAYHAIISASYISQTSSDPILTAIELHGELKEWAIHEPEFKDEYMRYADLCAKFAVALVSHCRTTEEVKQVINKRTAEDQRIKDGPKEERFSRIALAMRYEIKEFVTHSNCQEVMRCKWRKHWEETDSVQGKQMIKTFLLRMVLMPLFAVIYWVAPRSRAARSWNSPLTKFICAMAVYVDFLIILLVQNHLDAAFGNRGPPRTGFEVPIILFVSGKWWRNLSTLWVYGFEVYARHGWNVYDSIMLMLFTLTFICWGLSALDVARYGKADLPRPLWSQYDPRLIGEAFYAFACVFAFVKLLFFMQITSYFGPLQVSIGRLVGDLAGFLCMILLFIVAFSTGLWIIYRGYTGYVRRSPSNDTSVTQMQVYDILPRAMGTLYWSLYGVENLNNNDVVVPEFSVTIDNETVTVYNDHRPTEVIGYTLYGVASFFCIVIMLNMLIAVMTSSLSAVQEKADMEWKYARTKVWMNFFFRGDVLPSPFNLVPNVHSVIDTFRWCFVRARSGVDRRRGGSRRHRRHPRCNLYQCCYFDIEDRCTVKQQEAIYQQIMAKLIQRYFTSLSTDQKKEIHGETYGEIHGKTEVEVPAAVVQIDHPSDLELVKLQLRELTKMVQLLQLSVLAIKKS